MYWISLALNWIFHLKSQFIENRTQFMMWLVFLCYLQITFSFIFRDPCHEGCTNAWDHLEKMKGWESFRELSLLMAFNQQAATTFSTWVRKIHSYLCYTIPPYKIKDFMNWDFTIYFLHKNSTFSLKITALVKEIVYSQIKIRTSPNQSYVKCEIPIRINPNRSKLDVDSNYPLREVCTKIRIRISLS